MTMTAPQRRMFFMALRPAAQAVGEDHESYRRRILREELGVEHLNEARRTDGFDKLMQRVLSDGGDYARALEYAVGDVRRFRHLALAAASRIVGETDERAAYRYVASVAIQMRYSSMERDALAMRLQRSDGWDDFTDIQLRKIVQALNCHVRRKA